MNFWQIMVLIITAAISIVVIRISFNFDLNRYLENRRKIELAQLKSICPHGKIDVHGDKLMFTSYFSSPIGTTQYICSRCGLVVSSEEDADRIAKNYCRQPELFLKKETEFIKKAKKLKIV